MRAEAPPAPLASGRHVEEIDRPVQHQKPAQREVPMTRTGEPAAEPCPRGRRHPVPEIPPVEGPAWPERRVRREDLQAAPRHEEQQWHVQPVRQTDEPWLGTPALPPLIPIDCFHGLILASDCAAAASGD